MPLKHNIETWLVFGLALVTALAGIVSAFLPPISVSIWPWAIAFLLSVIYPLALYPLLRDKRADYEFRALHFAPAAILLLWLAFELLASYWPSLQFLQEWYTVGFSAIAVIIALLMLALFCFSVIRQWIPRLLLIAAILVPFILLALSSEYMDWDRKLAGMLWDGRLTGSGNLALDPSDDPTEEWWRAQLRQMQQRSSEISSDASSSDADSMIDSSAASSASSVMIAVNGDKKSSGSSSSVAPPPNLSHSGFGVELMLSLFAGSYCTAVHRRTIKRKRA